MAIAAVMNNNNNINNEDGSSSSSSKLQEDDHEHDMVMPGFRFHPTEEELVEFYLRRKVEGKRFNVDLITFLDLYRYDPWELPALAAIGEKEWYFYVPRDRKYRNGDRPNRVTTSGYWKATGADRMIRSENLRSIGLKKTLVFYSGKAPKGIRTSWIMNEYRLPQHETERLQKGEISLCRVYKRAGVEDHPSVPRSHSSSSSSRGSQSLRTQTNQAIEMFQANYGGGGGGGSPQQTADYGTKITSHENTSPSSSTDLALSAGQNSYVVSNPLVQLPEEDHIIIDRMQQFQQSKQAAAASTNSCNLSPNCPSIFSSTTSSSSHAIDELHKLVNNYSQQAAINHDITAAYNNPAVVPIDLLSHFSASSNLQPQQGLNNVINPAGLWDWSAISEASKDYTNLFK